MNDSDSDYEFYVGTATHLEGASLAIDGTARIDGKIVGKVAVKHLQLIQWSLPSISCFRRVA